MDLDTIKKSWAETPVKPQINDKQLNAMIANRGKSAFSSLLSFERLGIIVAIFCMPLSIMFFKKPTVMIFYFISAVVGLCWQVYKYRFLTKTDLANMDILQVAKRINTYKVYILKEFAIGILWTIAFFSLITWEDAAYFFPKSGEMNKMIVLLIPIVCTIAFCIPFYILIYWRNFKKLDIYIKEVNECEKENKDEEPYLGN